MKAFTIKGTVKKIDLGMGFWGIIAKDGKEYRPVNLAPAMQREGLKVSLKVVPVEEDMGMFMWGETVEIV
ncbi:MAG: hypothetical protein ACI85O_002914 [Saprospiraceae bacterium]|jgi:hypothetical protein